MERRIEEKDATSSKRAHDNADSSTASVSSSGDSAAQSILALLARELPKLVHRSRIEPAATPASSERSCKRLRQDHAPDMSSRIGDAPSLPGPDVLEPILTAYFAHIHPWIPMIHQGRFFQRLLGENEREELLIIIHSMVLAAAKFVPGAARYVRTHTRNWVVCTAMDRLSLENLQALIILAFNDFGDGNAQKADRKSTRLNSSHT